MRDCKSETITRRRVEVMIGDVPIGYGYMITCRGQAFGQELYDFSHRELTPGMYQLKIVGEEELLVTTRRIQ